MKELPIIFFEKEKYLLAVLADEIAEIGQKEEVYLKVKGSTEEIPVDKILDFSFVPLERLYPLPKVLRSFFVYISSPPWHKAIWGIIESQKRLFPVICLKKLLEENRNETL